MRFVNCPSPHKSREIQKSDSGLYAALKYSDAWKVAVRRAGLQYPELYQPRKWPRRNVLEMISGARAGLSVRSRVIEEHLSGLWEAGCREFGTRPRAVDGAGVDYPEREWSWKWPRDRVLREIRRRARNKRSLETHVVRRAVKGLVDAARR